MDIPDVLPAGQYVVYALIDPDDNLVYYIGQTSKPRARLAQHLYKWTLRSAKTIWIDSLKKRGKQPLMQVLEIVTGKKVALARERMWISQLLQQGMPLVNVIEQGRTFFRKHAIQAVRQERGTIFGCSVTRAWLPDGRTVIGLKNLLNYLELDQGSQVRAICSNAMFSNYFVYVQVNTRGGPQVISALVEGILPIWLARLELISLPAEKLALVEAFQQKAVEALCHYFSTTSR